jgi:hypothetical protein
MLVVRGIQNCEFSGSVRSEWLATADLVDIGPYGPYIFKCRI